LRDFWLRVTLRLFLLFLALAGHWLFVSAFGLVCTQLSAFSLAETVLLRISGRPCLFFLAVRVNPMAEQVSSYLY